MTISRSVREFSLKTRGGCIIPPPSVPVMVKDWLMLFSSGTYVGHTGPPVIPRFVSHQYQLAAGISARCEFASCLVHGSRVGRRYPSTVQPEAVQWPASASVVGAPIEIGCFVLRLVCTSGCSAETSSREMAATVLGILQPVKSLLTVPSSSVCIDNTVFRLHHKATTALLLVCCVLVSSKQFLGDPIDCIGMNDDSKAKKPKKAKPNTALNTYCWIHSTFTVPGRDVGREIGEHIPHPGVATPEEGDELKHHKYYQWVCFTLFFQAMLFYVPHYLWKMWEGGKCQMLVMDMQSPVTKEETRRDRQKLITDYFTLNRHHHNFYAVRFFFCEVLNFVNVIVQIYFTDLFLGHEFTTYGLRVVQYLDMDPEDRPDPMALVFPKMTKCTFHKYGASGTVQRIDGLCVLPINILNEKIYVMLWFWFIVLAALSGLMLLYRVALLLSPQMRLYLLMMRARLAPHDQVAIVGRKCQVGDWFVLQRMGKNMDSVAFKELIRRLASRFDGKDAEA